MDQRRIAMTHCAFLGSRQVLLKETVPMAKKVAKKAKKTAKKTTKKTKKKASKK